MATPRLLSRDAIDTMEQLSASLATAPALPCPEPGVYPNTPMVAYQQWAAASNSRLTRLMRSPAHLKASLEQPVDTTALIMGRAAHAAILEPAIFSKDYARHSGADRRGKVGRDEWNELVDRFGDGYVLKQDDYDAALKMCDAVRAHAAASKLLASDGPHAGVEFSIVYDAPYNAAGETTRFKARLDKFSSAIAGGVVVDVKTCRDASPREFERSIFSYGYHRQGAAYLDAARAVGLDAEHFVIIAVEKEPPYAVAVYRLTEGALDAGREQVRALLATYAMCEALGMWPAYPEDVRDVALPAYAWSQLDVHSLFSTEG